MRFRTRCTLAANSTARQSRFPLLMSFLTPPPLPRRLYRIVRLCPAVRRGPGTSALPRKVEYRRDERRQDERGDARQPDDHPHRSRCNRIAHRSHLLPRMCPSRACSSCTLRDPFLSASYPTMTWYSGCASARVRETGHRTGFPRTAAQSPRRTAINRLLDSAHRKHLALAPNIFHMPLSPLAHLPTRATGCPRTSDAHHRRGPRCRYHHRIFSRNPGPA